MKYLKLSLLVLTVALTCGVIILDKNKKDVCDDEFSNEEEASIVVEETVV